MVTYIYMYVHEGRGGGEGHLVDLQSVPVSV